MLVTHPTEDKCLLVTINGSRASGFPPSGFVEPGEFEHAVAREVKEETGIDTTDICYQAS